VFLTINVSGKFLIIKFLKLLKLYKFINFSTHVRGGQRPKTPHKRRPQKMSNLTQRIALFRKMKTIYKTEPKSSQSRPWAEQKWVKDLFEGAFLLTVFPRIVFALE
jgi:hypothetical protein